VRRLSIAPGNSRAIAIIANCGRRDGRLLPADTETLRKLPHAPSGARPLSNPASTPNPIITDEDRIGDTWLLARFARIDAEIGSPSVNPVVLPPALKIGPVALSRR